MTFRRLASALGTIALVLSTHSAPAAAHGVEVTAEFDGARAAIELTDETGEACVSIDPAPEGSAVAAIVDNASDDVVLILGEGVGTASSCQFFDVDTVNSILADVDGHRLVVVVGSSEVSGVLSKARLPASETAVAAQPDDGTNVPLVFGVGIALGLAGVVARKRFFS